MANDERIFRGMDTLNKFNKRLRNLARPRALRIIRLREKGKSWTVIGAMLGISRQRAQQIAAAHKK